MALTNWAGNITFGASRVHAPHEVAQLQELVAGAARIRALGTGHSFNRIADTDGEKSMFREATAAVQLSAPFTEGACSLSGWSSFGLAGVGRRVEWA